MRSAIFNTNLYLLRHQMKILLDEKRVERLPHPAHVLHLVPGDVKEDVGAIFLAVTVKRIAGWLC
jgi:hypothetical protein